MKLLEDSRTTAATDTQGLCLSDAVHEAMGDYFRNLNGHDCSGLYNMVISEVEKPLLHCVMQHTDGNQSQAAKLLGINRATLRKKLHLYNLTETSQDS